MQEKEQRDTWHGREPQSHHHNNVHPNSLTPGCSGESQGCGIPITTSQEDRVPIIPQREGWSLPRDHPGRVIASASILLPDPRATNTVQQAITAILYTSWKDWRLQLFCSFQIGSLIKAQQENCPAFPEYAGWVERRAEPPAHLPELVEHLM